MDFGTILLVALALAVDAFAVALTAGVTLPHVGLRHTFRLSWHFGLFQALMNILGWAGGLTLRPWIENFDHWVAFALLAFVGLRMIYEALNRRENAERRDPTRGRTLVMLSVATSIDSLAVGLSFALLKISVWFPALIIGIVASCMTAAGLHIGCFAKNASRLGAKAEIMGGLVLVVIGVRILSDHGVW